MYSKSGKSETICGRTILVIDDALEAGFNKVVFVIRKDLDKDFKEIIGRRMEKLVEVEYAYQELNDIPERFQKKTEGRKKPWGTGQAILCCKDVVDEPFLVINADDYYGKEAYREAYAYLTGRKDDNAYEACMVGFVLKNTLSDNGGVTRGVCKVDEHRMLSEIVETSNIVKTAEGAAVQTEDGAVPIDVESEVSMNMWGLSPKFFEVLEKGFDVFLEKLDPENLKGEYLLPTIIGDLLKEGKMRVEVRKSHGEWFGVTYKEDKPDVVAAIQKLIKDGVYPEKLF